MSPTSSDIESPTTDQKSLLAIFALFFAFIFLGGLGAWIGNWIGTTYYDVKLIEITQQAVGNGLNFAQRQAVRWSNLIAHILGFTASAFIVGSLFISPKLGQYFGLNRAVKTTTLLWSILTLFIAFPFIQLVIQLNLLLPLPESIAQMGSSQDWLVAEVLQMESLSEFLFVIIVAAVAPAIGEELLFRGVIQSQLQRLSNHPHLAIWLTAILFSAIHLQFAGFFPRLLLGAFLGYLYFWSATLWLPILIHFLFNGLQVTLTFFYPEIINNVDTTIQTLVWSDALIGIGSALLLWPLLMKIKGYKDTNSFS